MPDSTDSVRRLMDALAVHRAWVEQGSTDGEGLLARHEELRELLEPMVHGQGEEAAEHEPEELTLGHYRLRRELGRGGMGVVWLAWHPDLRREVALKVLPPHQALNPRAVARFQREASAMARLEHPGIVSVFEVGLERGQHYFAMEFLRGQTLEQRIAKCAAEGPSDRAWRAQAVEWSVQLCAALSYAHSRGVLHRDLKPANIMIEPGGRAVLTDFGLARLELGGPGLTHDGQFAGTPYYCAPEQAAGRQDEVGPPADVFALGVTLFELLALTRPFAGDTTPAVLHAIAHEQPKSLLRCVPEASRDLAAVVHRAMAKDPLQRYSSADAFGSDLRAVLEHRPVTARHASAVQRVGRWARRSPVLAMLVLVLALGLPLLSGLAGYVYASADEVAAGEAELHRRAVEEQVDRGYAHLAAGRLGDALHTFEQLVATEGALTEALAGELLVLGELLDPAPLASWAERWSTELAAQPVLRQVSEALRSGDRVDRSWLSARADWSATDCFVAASYCLTRAHHDPSGTTMAEAVYLFQQACLAAPRLHHLCGLARSAVALDDEATLDEAAEALERRYPDRTAALLTLSEVLRETAPDRALNIARRALAAEPERTDLQVNLAVIELATGQRSDAEKRLLAVLDREPEHREALGACAALARQDGDLKRARDLLLRAVGSPRTVVAPSPGRHDDYGTTLIRATPRPDLVLDLVEVLAELGQVDDAMALLARTRGLVPAFREPRIGVAQALLHAAYKDKARDLLAPLVAEEPADPLLWMVWAKVCNERKEYDLARQSAERALALDDSDPQAHYVHAVILFNLMRFADAAMAAQAAIALDPTSEVLSNLLIDVQTAQRDLRGVILEAERLAAALFAAGQPARAAATLEPYLKMPPAALLPEVDVIGPRVAAAHRRYRAAAGR